MVVEVARDDDVTALAGGVVGDELVDEAADEERLGRAPHEAPEVRFGIVVRGDERHLACRVSERQPDGLT